MTHASFGAWLDQGTAHFRLWAPSAARVELVIEGVDQPVPMTPRGHGSFEASLSGPSHGRRYRYRVDGRGPFPDPASRWQPDGIHGESAIDDPSAFAWRARPVSIDRGDLIIYELHTGTFTPEGTFESAIAKLPYLRDLGVTALELMPVAEFAGSRNWGYDGAALFAPSSAYGGPAGLRRFVDAAHQHGLSVILDVVYNHVGPDGAYIREISPEFFAKDAATPWGDAVNIAHPIVREWIAANAIHWARDYRVDGFRLDATHALPQAHTPAFIPELIARVRAEAGRDIVFIAEDHRRIEDMLRSSDEGGWGLDGVWADEFHHHVRVITAGDSHGYYRHYTGDARDMPEKTRMGPPFVYCIQNHDQIGNRATGDRLHHTVGLDVWRAATALLLLAPGTPLIFMGQEWAATTPFQYFTDHHEALGRDVTEGRRNEFRGFPEFRDGHVGVPDPQAAGTFEASRLRWDELGRRPHAGVLELYRTLITLRRSERQLHREAFAMNRDTIALASNRLALVARLRNSGRVPLGDRLAGRWRTILTTEDPAFAGDGPRPIIADDEIVFARPSALLIERE